MVDMGICSSGSALSMCTLMDFTSLMALKAGRILFLLYLSTKKKCQTTSSMNLHAHYQSIASTGPIPIFKYLLLA